MVGGQVINKTAFVEQYAGTPPADDASKKDKASYKMDKAGVEHLIDGCIKNLKAARTLNKENLAHCVDSYVDPATEEYNAKDPIFRMGKKGRITEEMLKRFKANRDKLLSTKSDKEIAEAEKKEGKKRREGPFAIDMCGSNEACKEMFGKIRSAIYREFADSPDKRKAALEKYISNPNPRFNAADPIYKAAEINEAAYKNMEEAKKFGMWEGKPLVVAASDSATADAADGAAPGFDPATCGDNFECKSTFDALEKVIRDITNDPKSIAALRKRYIEGSVNPPEYGTEDEVMKDEVYKRANAFMTTAGTGSMSLARYRNIRDAQKAGLWNGKPLSGAKKPEAPAAGDVYSIGQRLQLSGFFGAGTGSLKWASALPGQSATGIGSITAGFEAVGFPSQWFGSRSRGKGIGGSAVDAYVAFKFFYNLMKPISHPSDNTSDGISPSKSIQVGAGIVYAPHRAVMLTAGLHYEYMWGEGDRGADQIGSFGAHGIGGDVGIAYMFNKYFGLKMELSYTRLITINKQTSADSGTSTGNDISGGNFRAVVGPTLKF